GGAGGAPGRRGGAGGGGGPARVPGAGRGFGRPPRPLPPRAPPRARLSRPIPAGRMPRAGFARRAAPRRTLQDAHGRTDGEDARRFPTRGGSRSPRTPPRVPGSGSISAAPSGGTEPPDYETTPPAARPR